MFKFVAPYITPMSFCEIKPRIIASKNNCHTLNEYLYKVTPIVSPCILLLLTVFIVFHEEFAVAEFHL